MRSGFLLEHAEGLHVELKPDGMALPQQRASLDFRPPPNVLDPYQLELCADAFRQAWAAIVRPGCHLPKEEETRLENEISDRLCFLAARGVIDPQTLQGLTVATVRLHQRPPLRGEGRVKRPHWLFEERRPKPTHLVITGVTARRRLFQTGKEEWHRGGGLRNGEVGRHPNSVPS